MTYIRQTLLTLCITVASLGALAQNPEEHKTHHPEIPFHLQSLLTRQLLAR